MSYVVHAYTNGCVSPNSFVGKNDSGVPYTWYGRNRTDFYAVYSWRSGRNSRNALFSSEERHSTNVFDAMTARYQLYDRLARSSYAPERRGPVDKYVDSDLGHEFASYRWNRTFGYNTIGTANGVLTGAFPVGMHYPVWDGSSARSSSFIHDFTDVLYKSPQNTILRPVGSASPLLRARLSSVGANQIQIINPSARKASLMTTLLELARGDIPHLFSNLVKHQKDIQFLRTKFHDFSSLSKALNSGKFALKDASGDYLNGIFGWAPIVRDIESAFLVLQHINKLLFLSRDSRRQYRRIINTWSIRTAPSMIQWSCDSPIVGQATEHISGNGIIAPTLNTEFGVTGKLSVQTTAKFCVGLKANPTLNGYVDRGLDLLGLKITPEVIWELTPWTWLLDWFSNIGNVVTNLNSKLVNNVVMNYGYTTGVLDYTSIAQSVAVQAAIVSDHHLTKFRIQSNPFGLFADPATLNASQWSILAALGLSRSR